MIFTIMKMNYRERNLFAHPISQKEQQELEKYIRIRPLPRPKTTWISPCLLILAYLLTGFIVPFSVINLFEITKLGWLIYVGSYMLFFVLFAKMICIKSIECYQHYAKEETRRKCVCVPSCSEYSIAVLKKYNIFKALNKIRKRLFVTCGGWGYVYDEP